MADAVTPARRPRIAILGGKSALRAAHDLGAECVYIERPARLNAAKVTLADHVVAIDFTDVDALCRVMRPWHAAHPIDAVLTVTEDALLPAAALAESLTVPGTPSATVALLRDKAAMRRRLAGSPLQVPSVTGTTAEEVVAFAARHGYPCVVKPIAGSASRGVTRVRDATEAAEAVRRLGDPAGSPFLIETFLRGREFSVETLSFAGDHVVVAVTEKFVGPSFVEVGHLVPARLTPSEVDRVAAAATALLDAVGLRDGPAHTEVVLTADGARVVESHNRVGGDRINELVRIAYGVDMVEAAVGWALFGRRTAPGVPRSAAAIWFLTPDEGVVREVTGAAQVSTDPAVVEVEVSAQVGTRIGPLCSSTDRAGYVLVEAATPVQALASARRSAARIVIDTGPGTDDEGKSADDTVSGTHPVTGDGARQPGDGAGSPAAVMAAARLATKVLRDEAAAADEKATFPVGSLDALRQSGLLGLLVPTRFGGMQADLRTYVAVAGQLSGACLSTGMVWAMHSQQVAALVRAGSPSLRARLLPRIAAGTVYVASVTSERGKGGHLLSAVQPLRPCAAGVRVERNAPTVTGVRHADGFLITMRSAPEAPATSVSLVYVDRAQADVTVTGSWNPMGMRATESLGADIVAEVPADQIVGGSGEFRRLALHPFVTVGHLGWAACWLGAARSVFAEFVGLLRSPKHRRAFPLGDDLFGARLAEIRLLLDTASAFLNRVLDEVETLERTGGDPEDPAFQLHVNGLKVVVSDLSFKAVNQLMELAGLRHGYLRDAQVPVERVFRDMRSASLNYSNQRLLVANGWLSVLDRDVALL